MPYKNEDDRRAYQRKWISERKRLWFSDKCCADCGAKHHLQLDHKDPSKKWKHRIWSYSWARILVELAKCQVLCYDCHMKKSITERGDIVGKNEYDHVGCCCWECRDADLTPIDEWRAGKENSRDVESIRFAKQFALKS